MYNKILIGLLIFGIQTVTLLDLYFLVTGQESK